MTDPDKAALIDVAREARALASESRPGARVRAERRAQMDRAQPVRVPRRDEASGGEGEHGGRMGREDE